MKRKFFILSFVFVFKILFVSAQSQVVASSPTLQDEYAKKSGSLRFSSSTLNLGRIANNVIRKDTIRIFNSASRPVTMTLGGKSPEHLQLDLSTASLEPGREGWLAISFDAAVKKDYGFVMDRISLITNDSIQPTKFLNLTATIFQFFPPMSAEDSAMVQKARVPELSFNYGGIRQGEKRSHDFVIYNDGKKDLLIYKAKSSCGCIHTALSKTTIAPGDSALIKIDFDSFGKEGKDSRSVSVYLNDPAMPELKLEMAGEIFK